MTRSRLKPLTSTPPSRSPEGRQGSSHVQEALRPHELVRLHQVLESQARLMALNLWGIDPTGKAACYALHVQPDELDEWKASAEAAGWTQLTTGAWVDPHQSE